jgi:hypothetical protein
MKFAGIILSGKNKGDAAQYNPEEKAKEALKFVVTQNPEVDGEYPFKGRHVYPTEVYLEHVEVSLHGEPLGKAGYEHNAYQSRGTAQVQERDTVKDRLLPVRSFSFDMKFIDVLQENGLPDLEIEEFNIRKE